MPRGSGGNIAGFKLLSTPNAPTDLSVTAGLGNLTVSFTAPVDTGDAAVTEYVVTALNESSDVSTGTVVASSPASISPGTGTFSVRVQALNDFGPGQLTEYDTGNTILYNGAELYSWGRNSRGELGQNNRTLLSSPTQVGALQNWSQATGDRYTSGAVKTDGTIWAWGNNFSGQVGDNTTSNRSSPVQIGALTVWSSIEKGVSHTLALTSSGAVWAWGANDQRQLGTGNSTNHSSPVQVGSGAAFTNAVKIAAGGSTSFAIKSDGTLWGWGRNQAGTVGDLTRTNRDSPVQVGSLTGWTDISTSPSHHTLGVESGNLYAWGENDFSGVLNNGLLGINIRGYTGRRSSPVQVGALSNWSQVRASEGSSHAVKTDGTLWGWGSGADGKVGDNTSADRSSPVQIGALTNWSSVDSKSYTLTAVKTDNTLWIWGKNTYANPIPGRATYAHVSSPIQVGADTDWLPNRGSGGRDFILGIRGVT